jgi:hypothetical protein
MRRITAWNISRVREERAQGVVEFALIMSVLMMLFLGTIDFARFLYYETAIQDAARVGVETAINHCSSGITCGVTSTPMTSDFVLQAATCEAQPFVTLQPQVSCAPCSVYPCSSPCSGTCSPCSQDVCIDPNCSPSSTSCTISGDDVTVYVGYDFKPISFFLNGGQLPLIGSVSLFQDKSCYNTTSGSDNTATNHHTICAQATGRISTS